jgi:hypothetical protein
VRKLVKKALPKASSESARMAEVLEPFQSGDEYRGLPNLRWRYGRLKEGSCAPIEFLVAAKCGCGRWWGWTPEDRRAELLDLISSGCPGCSS